MEVMKRRNYSYIKKQSIVAHVSFAFKIVTLDNVEKLIAALNIDECASIERDLQLVLDGWIKRHPESQPESCL